MKVMPDAVDYLEHAVGSIRACTPKLRGSPVSSQADTLQGLEDAADDLRKTITLLRHAAEPVKILVRPKVDTLRAEIIQFRLLMDCCAAFYHGLDSRTGDPEPAYYDAEGSPLQIDRAQRNGMEA